MISPIDPYANTPVYLLHSYYLLVTVGAFFVYLKHHYRNRLALFTILIFWQGLFTHLDTIVSGSNNAYKVIIFFYALHLFAINIDKKRFKHDFYINLCFFLFSVSFWISFIINKPPLITTFSQFGFKYGIPFLLYHGLKDIDRDEEKKTRLFDILYNIILLQIAFSVAKLLILGQKEAIVGSIQHSGGGSAVFLPLLSMILIWLMHGGVIEKKDNLIFLFLLMISVISGKRATIILMPIYYFAITLFKGNKLRFAKALKYIPLVLLLFFLGVKLTPALNIERSYWGSFDVNYVVDYALKYNFGTKDIGTLAEGQTGRGASLQLIFQSQRLNLHNMAEKLFGKGIDTTALQKRGRFLGGAAYGIDHMGLIGAAVMIIYALGYFGFIFMFLFCLSLLFVIKNIKFRIVIITMFLYDFFLYGNILLFHNSLAFLTLFICLASNTVQLSKKTSMAPYKQ